MEYPGGGDNVAGAGVHGDHSGGDESGEAEAAEQHACVQLLPLLEEVFAGECPECGSVG